MTHEIHIFGASDDLIEVGGRYVHHKRGVVDGEEYNPPYDKTGWLRIVSESGDGLRVGLTYGDQAATWSATVAQLPGEDDEGEPIPWAVRVVTGREPAPSYSVAVVIELPDDCTPQIIPEWTD